jgi:hypothetical protein
MSESEIIISIIPLSISIFFFIYAYISKKRGRLRAAWFYEFRVIYKEEDPNAFNNSLFFVYTIASVFLLIFILFILYIVYIILF